jgi:hypothetical protein
MNRVEDVGDGELQGGKSDWWPAACQARPIPRVALLIESSRCYGRGILRGIADYPKVYGPWSIFHEERSLGERGGVSPAVFSSRPRSGRRAVPVTSYRGRGITVSRPSFPNPRPFSPQMGMTPGQYRRQLRIDAAPPARGRR